MVLPVLAAGAVALLLAPDATPAVPPRTVLVWVLAASGIATVLRRTRLLHLAAALLMALAAEHLLFSPGLPRGHDLLSHSWGLWAFFQNVYDGDPTPQWLHHLSLGLPLPMFYSPATYYAMTPFYWAGLSACEILKSALVLHAVVGALGMYFLGRRWTGSSRAGLAAAAAYAFGPYRLLDAHYRMALGESAALALFPLFFGLTFDPAAWTRRRVAATAVVAGGLVVTHPLSVLTAGVTALVWQGVEVGMVGGRPSLRRFGARAAAAVLGLALAGCFVVPLAHRMPSISLGRVVNDPAGDVNMALQGLRPQQPFSRLAWQGVFNPEPRGNPRDVDGREMPPYLGWGLVACSILTGMIGVRKLAKGRGADRDAVELPVAILAFVSLGLTFYPAAAVLAKVPFLPNLQFAWRFLGPATWAGALCVAFVARSLLVAGRGPVVTVLLALVVADGLPFTGAGSWVPDYEGFAHFYMKDPRCGKRWGCWEVEPVPGKPPRRVFGGFLPPSEFGVDVAHVKPGFGEYLNSRAQRQVLSAESSGTWGQLGARWFGDLRRPEVTVLDAAPYARWYAPRSNEGVALESRRGAGTIEVELPGGRGILRVLEQFNSGWQATLDGVDAAVDSTADGMIQVPVPPGTTRATLRFRAVGWDVRLGRTATLLAFAACFFLAFTQPPPTPAGRAPRRGPRPRFHGRDRRSPPMRGEDSR